VIDGRLHATWYGLRVEPAAAVLPAARYRAAVAVLVAALARVFPARVVDRALADLKGRVDRQDLPGAERLAEALRSAPQPEAPGPRPQDAVALFERTSFFRARNGFLYGNGPLARALMALDLEGSGLRNGAELRRRLAWWATRPAIFDENAFS
jgi:hypothetical protein